MNMSPEQEADLNKRLEELETSWEKFHDFVFDHSPKWLWRTFMWFGDIPYKCRLVKWFFVRGSKGWAPNDTWSFDSYLSRVISEGVAHLVKNSHGYKMGFCGACKKHERGNKFEGFGENPLCTCEKDWPFLLMRLSKDVMAVEEFDESDAMWKLLKTDRDEYFRLSKLAYAKQRRALHWMADHINGLWD